MKRTVEKLRRGDHATIVALGDSITATTFHTHGRMNWVQLLEEALFEAYGNKVCTVVNSGKCGGTVAEALDRLERDVLRFDPDLVIVAFGMNDAGGGPDKLSGFQRDVRKLVRRVRDKADSEVLLRTPNPVVACNGLPPEDVAAGQPITAPPRHQGLYAAALADLAEELHCAVVDHYKLWVEASFEVRHPVANANGLWLRMSDAVHPGYEGHLAFYRELAPLFDLPTHFPWEIND